MTPSFTEIHWLAAEASEKSINSFDANSEAKPVDIAKLTRTHMAPKTQLLEMVAFIVLSPFKAIPRAKQNLCHVL
jgi:hypothetical protein